MSAVSKVMQAASGNSLARVGQTAMEFGLPIAFGLMDYNRFRSEGQSPLSAGVSALGSGVLYGTLGIGETIALTAATAAPKAAINAFETMSSMSRNMNRNAVQTPFKNVTFNDSQQAYTMRQAGMQLAQASRYNLQQTLMGNEAQYMRL